LANLFPFLSALLQLVAAILALRLTRLTRGSWGWLLLALAMLLMALRRGLAGLEALVHPRPLPASELVSIAISILMVVGLVGVGQLLRTGHQAELALWEAEARAKAEWERMELRDFQAREAQVREAANQRAAELGRFLELVIDTASMWISTLDAEGRVVIWNRGAEAISGYSREEVLGRSDFWAWLYPEPGEMGKMASEVASLLQGGHQTKGEETTLLRKDGTLRTVAWYVCPIILEAGQPSGTLAVGHDVTELREAQEELKKVQTIHGLVVENSALGFMLIRNRCFEWYNERAAQILGLDYPGGMGTSSRVSFLSDTHWEKFASVGYPVLASGGYWDTRERLRRADGKAFWCRLVGKALDPANVQAGAIWLMEDVSSRVQAEEALAESEERFGGAFEGTQDALLLLTPKGIFDCNHQALRLFGIEDKTEILQRSVKDLCPVLQGGGGSSAEGWSHLVQRALVGEALHFQWWFRRHGAGEFPAEVHLNAFPMGRRKVLLACLRPAQVLERGAQAPGWETDLRGFLDRSPLATLIVDSPARRFVYCNQAALEMLRCRKEELYCLGPGELSPVRQPDGRSSVEFSQEMDRVALQGGSHRFRHVHRSPHREDFTVDVTLTALQPGFSPLLVVNWVEVSE